MALDRHSHGDDGAGHDVFQFRACSPINDAGRKVEQQVDDARFFLVAAEQPAIELLNLRADA